NRIQLLNDNSTLNSGMDIIKQIKDDTKYIYIPKAVSKSFVDAFIKNRNKLNCDIILNNPTSLIIDEELLNNLFLLKNKVYVLNLVNLVAIAYNPYSPSGYSFNNDEFKNELKVNINLPIFNVLEER